MWICVFRILSRSWMPYPVSTPPPVAPCFWPGSTAKWLGAAAIVDPRLTNEYVNYVRKLDPDMQVKVQAAVQRFHESVKRAWVPADYDKPIEPN
jgi:hypothetical protein